MFIINLGGTTEITRPMFWDEFCFFCFILIKNILNGGIIMVKVTLKDGSQLEFEKGIKVSEVAMSISPGLYKKALGAKINGKRSELMTPINEDCNLEILTFEDEDGRWTLRHTAAHTLAQAVRRLYPNVKLAIGPAIDNGFYYDFDADFQFTPEVLEKIEKEMKNIIKENLSLERFELPK